MINYTLKMGGSKVNNADDKKVFLKLFPIIRNDFILFENTDAEISKIEKNVLIYLYLSCILLLKKIFVHLKIISLR